VNNFKTNVSSTGNWEAILLSLLSELSSATTNTFMTYLVLGTTIIPM